MHKFSIFLKKSIEPIIFCLFMFVAMLLSFDKRYSVAVADGIKLWVASVLPALFPYFFITALLSSLKTTSKLSLKLSPLTRRVFNTGGLTGYAFMISVISGYPLGAKTVADLREKGLISHTEATRAAVFCSTPSPMFLMASVGNIAFGSFKFGLSLLLTCLISAFIVGGIFSFYKREDKPTEAFAFNPVKTDNIIYDSVYSSVISVLIVGGLITLFYLLTEILLSLGVLTPFNALFTCLYGDESVGRGVTLGLFECTKGIKTLSASGIGFWTLPTVATLVGFGGLSVITQSLAYLKKAKIKTAVFLAGKLLTAVTCFCVGILFSPFL